MARKVIGIDFGSSQSSIAMMEIGLNIQPELLNVGGGHNGQTMQTVLALDVNDDTLRAAGNEVKLRYREIADSSCKLVSDFKRYLGSVPNPSDSTEVAALRRDSEKYAKVFLREMAKVVEHRACVRRDELSSDDFVTCVAHPASWSDEQVRILKKIVKEAGFPADPERGIYSIPEPVAAVHALRMGDGLGFRFGDKPEHFMVIDFGGGTLDVCVIQTDILGRAPKILATAGDPELGGREFDDMVEGIFFRNNRDRISKNSFSSIGRFELRDQIKVAKESASEHFLKGENHEHPIKHTPKGDFVLRLYRDEFANLVKDAGYYDKIRSCIHNALHQAGIETEQITKVILTGGSSRWFFLREIVAKEFSLSGDRIFLTETPFTDVATGCAVSIGLSDQAPKKDGIWVKYRLSEDEPWSEAKCLLAPGRNDSRETMGVQYLCSIHGTRYLHSWRIYLSWWHGFEKTSLEPTGSESVIDAFCRSNWPPLSRLRNMNDALHDRPYCKLEDEYKVYLQYQEDAAGACTYHFEIVDHKAATYDAVLRTKGEEAARLLPAGARCVGTVIPGQCSYQGLIESWLRPKTRKMKEWTPKAKSEQDKADAAEMPAWYRVFRNPFKK